LTALLAYPQAAVVVVSVTPVDMASVGGSLNACPEIVLIDPVTANSTRYGFRQLKLTVTEAADDEPGCFHQFRLISIVLT